MSKSEYEFEFASNRMMFACGAIEWAHSTSSASSTSHPPGLELAGSDVPPDSLSTFKVGCPLPLNCGRPNALLNVLASEMMSGSL